MAQNVVMKTSAALSSRRLAVAALGVLAFATAPRADAGARPESLMSGLWVWKPMYVSDLAKQDEMLAFCQRQGFNRLLIQVPWVKGTAQIVHPKPGEAPPDGAALKPQISYAEQFTRLIIEAAKHGIAVEALDGAPYMGDKVHWPETLATVDAIVNFNKSLPADAKLAGLHWDIEPYVRADWKVPETRTPIELDYLQLLTDAKKKLAAAGSSMTLSVDIPMWYDNKTDAKDSCVVTFNGQTKNFHEHIQDITDYVGIMSYRQKALGPNSASAHVANEMAYAEKIGKFVVPALETIELKDTPQITFFGKDAAELLGERQKLIALMKDRPGFGGVFLHHYASVRAMLEPTTLPAK
ncbi:MAG: hypothetical protein JWM57_2832 [Phycisphaerales bacterium]|nr:hypothetical protein [Phycisphaerales bacterium]